MTASTTAMASSPSATLQRAMWDKQWRTAGLQFIGFSIIVAVIYGAVPRIGASGDTVTAFYAAHRTRILIASFFAGLNLLNLLWFAASLRNTLVEAGQEGWATAASVSSAAFGALYYLIIAIGAALAYSIAGSGNGALTSALNDFAWVLMVLISFPRAMLIMSGVFGLWRAGMISSGLFTAGVVAVVLGVLGGTTWMSDGFWSPTGAFALFVSPILLLAWIVMVSRVLLTRPLARAGW
ncbi:MAG: hypothetical protein ACJ8AK_07240 [Gemmatimonadaceae bacterium]